MNLAPNSGSIKVNLYSSRVRNWLAAGATSYVLASLTVRTDRDEMIARRHASASRGRAGSNRFGDDALRRIDPSHSIGWRRLVTARALHKVQHTGGYEQQCSAQKQPSSPGHD